MASEEEEGIIQIPENDSRSGKYVLMFDPLDGSSNIDVNVPVGTIFSVYKKITRGARGEMEDMLQPGRRQVAAGYVIYGSSTMMVYTTGQGAHGFTLDPSIGEFLLSHPHIQDSGERALSCRSTTHTNRIWPEPTRALMRRYRGLDGKQKALNVRLRWIPGGGFPSQSAGRRRVCVYPANAPSRRRASCACCTRQIHWRSLRNKRVVVPRMAIATFMHIEPTELHQRTPLYIGSKKEVDIVVSEFGIPAPPTTVERRKSERDREGAAVA